MKLRRVVGTLTALMAISALIAPNASASGEGASRTRIGVDPSGHLTRTVPSPSVSMFGEVPDIPWPPAGVVTPKHSADKLREFGAAVTAHLARSFPKVVPEAQNMRLTPWSGETVGVIEDGQDYLTSFAVYHDKIGRTGTAYQVEAPGHFAASPREWCRINAVHTCTASTRPDGSLVLHGHQTFETSTGTTLNMESALHYRLDGSVVWTTAYDYDPIFDENTGPDRDKIALTTEQLTALATDPALHL